MLFAALAFLAGICLLFVCPDLPDPGLSLLFGLPAAVLAPFCVRCRWLVLLVAGFCWTSWHADQLLELELPPALEGRQTLVRGIVAGLPQNQAEGRLRLRFDIQAYRQGSHWLPLELPARLSWQRPGMALQPGQHWQLQVRLKSPHGFANPGGFDYERWLFARRIRATGYVRHSDANRYLGDKGFMPVGRLRYALSERLQGLPLAQHRKALLRALAVGDRSGISTGQWQILAQTGTSHLLAISGLHVGLVAGLMFALVRRIWPWSGCAERCPAPKAAAFAALVMAWVYALLAGFEVPAQRALVMVCVWMTAIILNGRAHAWQVFAVALWLVLLMDPLAVLSAGFWLSFTAVAWIMYLTGGRVGRQPAVKRLLTLQLGLLAGLTPLLWIWFQQTALAAPLANLVAIPLVGLLVVPLILMAALLLWPLAGVAEGLFSLAGWLLQLLWQALELIAAIPGSSWLAPPLGMVGYALTLVGLALLLAPRRLGSWPLAAAILLPLSLARPLRPAAGDVWMTVLDVGQGLSVAVETRRHLLIYDTGPAFPSGFNTGDAVVVPFLRTRGYTVIDRLLVSHADIDHRGGATALAAQFDIGSVHSGEPQRIALAGVQACRRGEHWSWDGVDFDYLAPARSTKGNNASCVLKVTAADGRVLLLPGDIEASAERRLIASDSGEDLAADVLVAPHHGSLTSSTPAFVARVKPALVVFPSGFRNRFGFPKAQVVSRYRSHGSRILDTGGAGAISVKIEAGRALGVSVWREQAARFWRRRKQ